MIKSIEIRDARYSLGKGVGSDAIHRDPIYSYAVVNLEDDSGLIGSGFAFTLGEGNDLVCKAAHFYANQLKGSDIEEVMANFGVTYKSFANEQQFRWLGPQKGIVHLALAAVTNACWDLWAKKRGVPLWKLMIDLSAEELVNTIDLSYLEDELTREQAIDLILTNKRNQSSRTSILDVGYPGYDTSIGWFNYPDHQVRDNVKRAVESGFTAIKLKVGSKNPETDIRRSNMVREVAGDGVKIMLDANQQWNLPEAITICRELSKINPYWIEEPTHPDDILAHKVLCESIAPIKLALGEHVPNAIIFKNYLQVKCAGFMQVDAVRVGGVSEFLAVSLLCRKFNVPVVPHVGDMGQLHQHLVLFNHITLGHEALFLEHIPHLKQNFVNPVQLQNGYYLTPQDIGSSCDLKM
ncbi:enolase C-terminal domain-like protein [Pedobacter sp. D749]|uniref:enolase C-terminal domain-like protein n=1 Tax=Pedobacter sp. D749 TaxID=2856523 RepID=UPI001C56B59D|nr:enolase C-terminal domain-like protein [Pedobacter sp. D749]QXU43010.1 mandelate racemase [Pedobacter sp. D749]